MDEGTERSRAIERVTLWGAVVNLLLSIGKLCAGILGRSSAMVADAVHSFSDLASDAVIFVCVRISSKGKDKSHDYGHGKFETLATSLVSLLLLVVAAELMKGGIMKITAAVKGEAIAGPGMIALWAAVASIVLKEILYQWTAFVGRRTGSPAVIANAWHHRTDALSSVGSLAGIGGAIFLGGKWAILDPIAACIISIVIIVVAVKMLVPAIRELMEESLPEDTENEILEIIGRTEGVQNVHDLKTRHIGPDKIIDVHIVVAPTLTVVQAHDITEKAESAIRESFGQNTQISIHVEPDENAL